MKTVQQLQAEGYNFKAYSSNGAFMVTSFIAIKSRRKVYGHYSEKEQKYIITNI